MQYICNCLYSAVHGSHHVLSDMVRRSCVCHIIVVRCSMCADPVCVKHRSVTSYIKMKVIAEYKQVQLSAIKG